MAIGTGQRALDRQLEENAAAEADLRARIRDERVEHVYYQFLSLSGRVLAKVVPAEHLARNLYRGVQFHGAAVTDMAVGRDGALIASGPEREEILAVPDASTFAVLPWDRSVGRFICNVYRRTDARRDAGEALPLCARGNLARQHAAFEARTGLRLRSGTEPEMSWLGDPIAPWWNDHTDPSYHFGALELMRPIVKRVAGYGRALGLTMIEGDYEDNGQLELNFEFDDCERTCDRLVTYRQICVQVADELGVTASFMPKPSASAMANGCHHNISLWRDGENAFRDLSEPTLHLTEVASHALGGILAHSRGMLALVAPTVNSYARYWHPGSFAPLIANWGFDNRTCAVRVSASGRLEFKLPDASVNPYLSHAAILASIADGLERRLDPGPAQAGSSYDQAVIAADEATRGFGSLPKTLGDALAALRDDPIVQSAFPAELVDAFVALKTAEWEEFCAAVTDWHRDRYLRAIP
jgi:glutamine synthetase